MSAPGAARSWWSRLLAAVLAAAVSPSCVVAQQAAVELEVEILRPAAGMALFGEQEIRVEVRSPEPVARVVFRLDGRPVATLTAPPYRVTVDFGEDNRDHHVEVVAHARSGASARARLLAPAIRVHEAMDLELQQVYVTATRRKRRVLDLEAADFTLFDDGVRQEIVTFKGGDIPFAAVLVLDGSDSMQGERLEAALAGARAFVRGMRPLDEARLLVVADRVLEVTPFVGRGEPLAEALEGTAATGGTALYDYLFVAFDVLESRQGRRVVILLSDGQDFHSALSIDDLRQVVRRSRALFYWLRIEGAEGKSTRHLLRSSWRRPQAAVRAFKQLAETVRDSGGRILDVARPADMGAALQEILAELREQYAIGYYPQPRRNDGSWRRVEVEVRRRGLELRWRPGYFDR